MDNFKTIYMILRELESALDDPCVDESLINYRFLKISERRWARYIEMMLDMELIKGAAVKTYNDGGLAVIFTDVRITLKGLEYLTENSVMQKIYKTMKNIKEAVPFI